MIKVLIVDDSQVVRQHLKNILEADPDIRVLGVAENGEAAVKFVQHRKPDVITMDITMPRMNGYEATRRIMETCPVPIVIVSASYHQKDVEKSFHALDAGAITIIEKPVGEGHVNYQNTAGNLVQTVKLMSEIKVIKRWPKSRPSETINPVMAEKNSKRFKLVAIGASTGGPPALQKIFSGIPRGFPLPVLVVQHIAKGFLVGLKDWLQQTTRHLVHIATYGERLQSGHIYLAPEDFHMGIGNGGQIVLSKDKPENGVRPSVSYLFRSVIHAFDGNTIGVLLSGMGKDGAEELKIMKENGASTIAQDEESSVVYGMPGEAVKLGAATYILSPEKIPVMLERLVNSENR